MRVVRAGVAAVLITLSWPVSADAACSSAWVTFSEVAPNAARVVIGTVADGTADPEEPGGYASVFTVNVEEVLRGPNAAVVDMINAINNAACGTAVVARNGDRIALGMGGSALGSDDVSAIAYLAGVPYRPDIEVMSRAEAYAAAGVELPDTSMGQPAQAAPLGWLLVGVAVAVRLRGCTTQFPGKVR